LRAGLSEKHSANISHQGKARKRGEGSKKH
jgi:hypothetical protein